MQSPSSAWMHASNLPPEAAKQIAEAAELPYAMVEAALRNANYPRLESVPKWYALMFMMPPGEGVAQRNPVLLLVSKDALLTLALQPVELQTPLAGDSSLPWGPRCMLHLARAVLDRNEVLADRFENELRELEDLPADQSQDRGEHVREGQPADQSPETFFGRTFKLKRDLSSAKGDLWRLRALLETLAEGRRTLPGLPEHTA